MYSSVLSAAINGVECFNVNVEADVSDGLPMFCMVGDLSPQVREAQERVKTALRNSDVRLQPKKITINLSPADLRKDGTAFDLPVALAVLLAYGYLDSSHLENTMVIGELGLDGQVKGVRGVLPMVRHAARHGIRRCVIPKDNAAEGGLIEGIKIIGVSNIREVIGFLTGNLKPVYTTTNIEGIRQLKRAEQAEDFGNICGQSAARRGAEIAAAGLHNLLLLGPPGASKSMIAKCFAGIMPQPTPEESLEISEIYSIAGLLSETQPLVIGRPYRTPHHMITAPALVGGGQGPLPGEISLAHRGVLFLDELAEFKKPVLEMLRQPMEDKQVQISRRNRNYLFPANCVVVAAMNPCKCGYYPDRARCVCSEAEIHQYLHKISGPFLDRMDISVEAARVEYDALTSKKQNETSEIIRVRVLQAQEIQQQRYAGTVYRFNADLGIEGIRKFCSLGSVENKLMEQAYQKLNLSARGYHRLLKVARTIADLDGEERIKSRHIAEAVCYRSVEQKYWN